MIEMRRNIVLCTIALVLFLAYFYVSTISSLYSAAFPAPKWWSPLFPTHLSAALSWMILRHAAAVLLAATPFSLLVIWLYPRRWLLTAIAISLALFGVGLMPGLTQTFVGASARMRAIDLLDAVEILGTLPLLSWIFHRLSSNSRLERSRAASLVSQRGSR
ncbi:MAG TPA: hypothetical protein VKH13_00400 [Steroidobacteraceae bacterium]|nr:hypothetical protein [Steroidobacteraceae bacterium]